MSVWNVQFPAKKLHKWCISDTPGKKTTILDPGSKGQCPRFINIQSQFPVLNTFEGGLRAVRGDIPNPHGQVSVGGNNWDCSAL
jgi:hypothetical protein